MGGTICLIRPSTLSARLLSMPNASVYRPKMIFQLQDFRRHVLRCILCVYSIIADVFPSPGTLEHFDFVPNSSFIWLTLTVLIAFSAIFEC